MRIRSINSQEISQLILWATEQCQSMSDSPRLDAEILLAHVLEKPRSYLRTWPDKTLNQSQLQQFQTLIAARLKPTPVAYLVGYKEFWSRSFKVDEHTLVPRPDTELLIETALSVMKDSADFRVLDLGTGSGCIAVTLKKECPNCQVTASDVSAQALHVAKHNGQQHAAHIDWIESSWFEHIPQQDGYQLIVSNPPYIKQHDPHLKQGDLLAEPLSALASGDDGLDDINVIIEQSKHYLVAGGVLLIEHGYDQKEAMYCLFEQAGFKQIEQRDDLGGNARLTMGVC